jgi:hypothetical protein
MGGSSFELLLFQSGCHLLGCKQQPLAFCLTYTLVNRKCRGGFGPVAELGSVSVWNPLTTAMSQSPDRVQALARAIWNSKLKAELRNLTSVFNS